jgi:hypothetical protein
MEVSANPIQAAKRRGDITKTIFSTTLSVIWRVAIMSRLVSNENNRFSADSV